MAEEDRINPTGPYRGVRPIREGSVFAKYRVRKKLKKTQEKPEETSSEKSSSEHRIDIQA